MTRLTLCALSIPLVAWLGPTPALAQATSSIKCSDGVVTVSTGTSGGTCVKGGTVITCGQNQPDQAGGGCDASGKASCGNTTGAGSCTIAQAAVRPPKVVKRPPVGAGGVVTRRPQ